MNALKLTQALIPIRSVSNQSNEPIANYLQAILEEKGWAIERTSYLDPNGIEKINLVAKLGEGTGGLAFCSHVDTVPGQEEDWPAFTPEIRDGKLWGRGSCDMKGPIAATIEAALSIDPTSLKKPIYIILTSDEELGLIGAKFIKDASAMLKESKPEYGIIAEPTNLIPVYSHKGYSQITVTAKGRAAHSSLGIGESSMIKSIPFLTELYELEETLQSDASYQNDDYRPTHHTMNIKVDSGATALNVTAPKTTTHIAIRTMPNSRSREVTDLITEKAQAYGFEVDVDYLDALYCPPDSELVQRCVGITGKQPETVSYGTDGNYLMDVIGQLVVLGPGDIAVAHTIREHVPISQLEEAVKIYRQLIADFCC